MQLSFFVILLVFSWMGDGQGVGGKQFLEEREAKFLNPAKETLTQSHCQVLVAKMTIKAWAVLQDPVLPGG